MASSKAKKLLHKSALLQGEMLEDLQALVKSIERAEILLAELKRDAEAMTARHPATLRTTREDIAYLEDLLKCAKKKLAWEKQMEALAKRTPEVLTKVSTAMNDTAHPPEGRVRHAVLELLQTVQASMNRLDAAKAAD
jgi:hypothetical protein